MASIEGEHGHEVMSVRTGPGSALEVVDAEFLLDLLVRLLSKRCFEPTFSGAR